MALTHTAPGHATIATGAWPSIHGVVANQYMDGDRPREAVEDPSCPQWNGGRGVSASTLQAPTFADALKLATFGRARVLSVAIKDRGALFLAGQSADLALFYDTARGELTSTTCYANGPPDWLVSLQRAHPPSEWKDYVWTVSRPEAVYARLAEEHTEARDVFGIGSSFPHRIGQGEASTRLFRSLRATPASTTIVLRAARAGLDAMQLGQRGQTDLLLLSLGGVDYVGHSTGTGSRERMDVLLRMHDELGAFLGDLRARFGDRLSVLLSSDHGATPTPPTAAQMHVRARQVAGAEIVAAVEKALDDAFGPHQGWVLVAEDGVLGLRRFPDVDPVRAGAFAAEALRRIPGVWKAVTQATIADSDAVLRHSWFPGRSGDVLFAPAPLTAIVGPEPVSVWAAHGSPWADDSVVPLLAGAPGYQLKAGETLTVTQIAPAAALLLGVAPPAAAFDPPALVRAERRSPPR
jgi:type I phosphodiesterase/nucleotide pyrophosphatase